MLKLEIIGFNIESCVTAQLYGANRIELCDNPSEGGTTPSAGFIKAAREKLNIELYVMIRPRGGDFNYSADELNIMQQDIITCKESGCDGVVFGILDEDGTVNQTTCAKLVELAYPMGATFHRAFDHAANPFQALEEIIDAGFERILTSGHMPTAMEGRELIGQLVRQAENRIIIMPGAGVRSANIDDLAEQTGAREFHSSASISKSSSIQYFNPAMTEELTYIIVNAEEVRDMVSTINKISRLRHEN